MAGLPSLSATIATFTLFDNTAVPTTSNPHPNIISFTQPITGYRGERLYCKALVQGDTLKIIVDAVGPSTLSVPTDGPITKAEAQIFYANEVASTKTEIAQASSFVYNGAFLVLTAELQNHDTVLALSLTESKHPDGTSGTDAPVGYVIVKDDSGRFQLRWVDMPVQLKNDTSSAQVRKRPPTTGAGVSGPMGLETP